jgi:uncharacterized protein (TIGR00369 family)
VDYFGIPVPFMAAIGLEPVEHGTDDARTRLPFRAEWANRTGHVHGGMLMGALDFTMSAAARGKETDVAGLTTIEMKTSFVAPASAEVLVEARCLRRGRSIAFCEGEARAPSGELLAKASATFKLTRRKDEV